MARSKYFTQGCAAFNSGEVKDECPYDSVEAGKQYTNWMSGWEHQLHLTLKEEGSAYADGYRAALNHMGEESCTRAKRSDRREWVKGHKDATEHFSLGNPARLESDDDDYSDEDINKSSIAYIEGREAFFQGNDENPYDEEDDDNEEAHYNWKAGWTGAWKQTIEATKPTSYGIAGVVRVVETKVNKTLILKNLKPGTICRVVKNGHIVVVVAKNLYWDATEAEAQLRGEPEPIYGHEMVELVRATLRVES